MPPCVDPKSYAKTEAFILEHWNETVRSQPDDSGTLIGLPHPYTIPCRKGTFQEMYYWDTYFTMLGLVAAGRHELARANVRNLLSMVERFGFVPNGNRTYYLTRSQPPYLAAMVGLVAAADKDISFAREAVPLLECEYIFWTTQRMTPTGLSRHGHHATEAELLEFFPTVKYRLGFNDRSGREVLEETSRAMAECETGWDFNHRFEHRCPDFCPVDLNSTLYLVETLLAQWTDGEDSKCWRQRAEQRRERVNELCWNETLGGYFDYDFVNERQSTLLAASAFQPLWAGLADPRRASLVVQKALPLLEYPHGISTTPPGDRDQVCQWDYPNAWPCLQHIVYRGLERFGYTEEARRIAGKYVATVVHNFETTGDLWEKYNAVDGTIDTAGESGYLINPTTDEKEARKAKPDLPSMMGWTAGVFMDAVEFLRSGSRYWLFPG